MSLSRLASQQVARNVDVDHAALAVAQPNKDDRFDLLTKYIPTETLTIYVAAMAILPSFKSVLGIDGWAIYVAGAALTPVTYYIAGLSKFMATGSGGRYRPQVWPGVAATIAFLIWALSVPGLLTGKDELTLAGFAALVVSTLLTLLAAVFDQDK